MSLIQKTENVLINKTEIIDTTQQKTDLNNITKSISTKKENPKQEVNELFNSGLEFFGKLGNIFNKLQTGEVSVNDFIKKDEKTGQTSINIPVKDTDTVVNAISSIANLFNSLNK